MVPFSTQLEIQIKVKHLKIRLVPLGKERPDIQRLDLGDNIISNIIKKRKQQTFKFFSGEFTQAFELISEQPQIILKIQNAFDKLANLLDTKAELIKPIFIAICSKNEQLGDWIMINRFLKLQTDAIKKKSRTILILDNFIDSRNNQLQQGHSV